MRWMVWRRPEAPRSRRFATRSLPRVWGIGVVSLFCLNSCMITAPEDAIESQGTLLFASGFEQGVKVEPEYVSGGQWWQKITGTDRSTGFTWIQDLGVDEGGFQPLVAAETANPSRYTLNRIETVRGPSGQPTRVLYQQVTRDDPAMIAYVRSNYFVDPGELQEAYSRCWVYLQPDLQEVMSAGGKTYNWRQLWEMKCAADALTGDPYGWSYRYNVTIIYTRSDGLFFQAGSEIREVNNTDWSYENPAIRVPVGEWFLFEVYFKQSTHDGRFLVRINGDALCDHHGRTMVTEPAEKWSLVKCYTNAEHLELHGNVAWQRVDDLRIYDSLP